MDYYSFNRPQRDGWLSWPCWLTDSERFTHTANRQSSLYLGHFLLHHHQCQQVVCLLAIFDDINDVIIIGAHVAVVIGVCLLAQYPARHCRPTSRDGQLRRKNMI